MTPITLMVITGALWVILFAGVTINFCMAAKSVMDFDDDGSTRHFMGHVILGGLLTVDGLAFFVGLGWFLVEKFG